MKPDAVKVGQRGTVVIPAPLRQRLSIDDGSYLLVEEHDGGLLLRPAVVAPVEASKSRGKSVGRLLKSMRQEILRIAANNGARNLRLFGSAARGEAGAKSDLDFLVEMEEGRSLLDLVALEQDLSELLGREVEVITDAGVSRHLRERVYAEAVPL